jgi:hypothetical protein
MTIESNGGASAVKALTSAKPAPVTLPPRRGKRGGPTYSICFQFLAFLTAWWQMGKRGNNLWVSGFNPGMGAPKRIMKLFALAILAVSLMGCGPKKIISYKADNRIRADYLVDSVRVKFKIEPECRSIYWLYLFWTVKCGDPYTLDVSLESKHQSRDSNTVAYQSLKIMANSREYEMLNPQDTSRRITLTPSANGMSVHHFKKNLGKTITLEKAGRFKVELLYTLGTQTRSNRVEKEFNGFEERHFTSIFTDEN